MLRDLGAGLATAAVWTIGNLAGQALGLAPDLPWWAISSISAGFAVAGERWTLRRRGDLAA